MSHTTLLAQDCRQNTGRVLSTSNRSFYDPRIGDGRVVWYSYDGNDAEIYSSDGLRTLQLTNNNWDDFQPRISGNLVAWVGWDGSDYEVFIWNGASVINFSDNSRGDFNPEIDDGWITWQQFDGQDWEIMLWDGTQTRQITFNTRDDDLPRISDGRLTWHASDGNDSEVFFWDGTSVVQLTANNFDDGTALDIDRGNVAWIGGNEVYLWNGTSTQPLSNNSNAKQQLDLDNGMVTWAEWDGSDYEIFLFDGATTRQLTSNAYSDSEPRLHEGQIAWKISTTPAAIAFWDGYQTQVFSGGGSADLFGPDIFDGQLVWSHLTSVYPSIQHVLMVSSGSSYKRVSDHVSRAPAVDANQMAWLHSDGGDNDVFFKPRPFDPAQLMSGGNPFEDRDLRLDAGQLAWSGSDGSDFEIYFWDGSATVQVTANDLADDVEPSLRNGGLAWMGYEPSELSYEVYFRDGSGVERLTFDGQEDRYPAVDGRWVAWSKWNWIGSQSDIFVWDGDKIMQLTNTPGDDGPQVVTRRGVVSWACPNTSTALYDVCVWRQGQPIQRLSVSGFSASELSMDDDGSIAWSGTDEASTQSEIFIWNGTDIRRLTDNGTWDTAPRISKGHVAWTSWDGNDDEVFHWDGHAATQVTSNLLGDNELAMSGEYFAWTESDQFGFDVFRGDVQPYKVRELRFDSKTTLYWEPASTCSVALYDLVRGDIGSLAFRASGVDLGTVSCILSDFVGPMGFDPETPLPGAAWFYVVRATEGGSYGMSSDGRRQYPSALDCQ